MPEIIYESKCNLCELHLTDLGTLKSLEEIVNKEFPAWSIEKKAELVINWFERTWQQELAKDEKKWKQDMANQIQKSKEKNIKEINK